MAISFFDCNDCGNSRCKVNQWRTPDIKACLGRQEIKRTIPFPVLLLNHPEKLSEAFSHVPGIELNLKLYIDGARW